MTPFTYQSTGSRLHRLDPRCKLAALVLLSAAAGLAAHWWQLALLACAGLAAVRFAKLPLGQLLRSLWFFWFLIAAVVVSYALTFGGPALFTLGGVAVSAEGLDAGLRFGAKLLVIIAICAAITATTPPSTLGNAAAWFLKPVPFVPAARVGTAINLTLVLIPMIFACHQEVQTAARARCIDLVRNPARRLMLTVRPTLELMFLQVERMAVAMEARCYNDERTMPTYRASRTDHALLAACVGLLVTCIF